MRPAGELRPLAELTRLPLVTLYLSVALQFSLRKL